ncbi:MAG: hypothetical protein ACE5K8_04980 [Candidatus Zixiibacteriota bacterium]
MRNQTAAILLSRQPLRPTGQTAWVKQTVQAVRWIKQQGFTLCTSIGMQTWELLTSLASLEEIEQTMFVPARSNDEFEQWKKFAHEQFSLKPGVVNFILVLSDTNATKEQLWLKRDHAITRAADFLVPVSVRKGGHMAALIRQLGAEGKKIEGRFQTTHEKRTEPLAYNIQTNYLNPELLEIKDQYVIHWTRASNSAWPTERLIDYYRAIIESETYPRSAFHTLTNIISTKRICASPKHMPLSIPTVSFSGLPPVEVIPLMKWRSRYQQMSFEPYGIGFKKDNAIGADIHPVRYFQRGNERINDKEPWLWQSLGEKGDWRAEREYRHKGDLDFSQIPAHRMCAFCCTKREAQIIEESTGIRAVSFLHGDKPSF